MKIVNIFDKKGAYIPALKDGALRTKWVKQNAEKLTAVFSQHKIVLFYGERKDIIDKLEEHMKG